MRDLYPLTTTHPFTSTLASPPPPCGTALAFRRRGGGGSFERKVRPPGALCSFPVLLGMNALHPFSVSCIVHWASSSTSSSLGSGGTASCRSVPPWLSSQHSGSRSNLAAFKTFGFGRPLSPLSEPAAVVVPHLMYWWSLTVNSSITFQFLIAAVTLGEARVISMMEPWSRLS